MLIMNYTTKSTQGGFHCMSLNSLNIKYKIPAPELESHNIIDAVICCDRKLILIASDMNPKQKIMKAYKGTRNPTFTLWDLNTGERYQSLEIKIRALKLFHFDKPKEEEGCYFYQICSFTSNPLIKYQIHYKVQPPYFEAIQKFKYPSFQYITGTAELFYLVKTESLFVTNQMAIYDIGKSKIELYQHGNFRGMESLSYAGNMKFMLGFNSSINLYNILEDKIEKEWNKDKLGNSSQVIRKVRAYGENIVIAILHPFRFYKIYLDSGKTEYIKQFALLGVFEEIE